MAIKEIKIILQKLATPSGVKFTVVEMVGGIEVPLKGVTIALLKDNNFIFTGWTDENGVYQELGKFGEISYKVSFDGYVAQTGTAIIE